MIHPLLSRRDNPPRPTIPPSIWTPTVVIFAIFVGLTVLGCIARTLLRRNRAARLANATTNRSANATDPADQSTSADAAELGNANPTRRPRRPRRPRRTPSQISVTSLPEYMKEPGEQELVIIRGQSPEPEGGSNVTMPIPSPADDQRYYSIPTSTTTTPLLHEHDLSDGVILRNNDDTMPLQDLSQQRPRTMSIDTNPTSISLPAAAVPIGPAPPPPPAYFEVTANDDDVPVSAQTYYPPSSQYSILSSSTSSVPLLPSSTSIIPDAPRATRGTNRHRQSGFRTFLNRVSMSMPGSNAGPGSNGHRRTESSNSITSTTSFFRRPESSLSSVSHSHHTRQNPSLSQSRASLLSTSPSTISINSFSISAPLTHTASRTQFTFPQSVASTSTTTAAGGVVMMTPDQVRVIAAREAIGKFGLPYGPDAVAFAAARGTDGPPPPGFDEVVGFDEEEENGSSRVIVREESSASASTVRPQPQPQPRDSILEPTTNGISSSPTPIPISLSEFGQIPIQHDGLLLSPKNDDNDLLRSGSVSSNYSSQTYATAVESLLSVPLAKASTTDSSGTSRTSSYCAVAVGGDVVRGWSSSEEEVDYYDIEGGREIV